MFRLLKICILAAVGLSLMLGCGKSPEQEAYEEVLSTLSMDKAKKFFDSYPKSRYRDTLVTTLIEWCGQEKTGECYSLILKAIPKEHPRYMEVSDFYESRFKEKKTK